MKEAKNITILADAPGCPKLKRCDVSGLVLTSRNNDFIPTSDLKNTGIQLGKRIDDMMNQLQGSPIVEGGFHRKYISYNIACALSLAGDTRAALRYMKEAVDYGVISYNNVVHDTDLDNIRGTEGFKPIGTAIET